MKIYIERGPDGKENVRIEGLNPEQQQLFDERKFMLRVKVQASARPKSAKIVECFTCDRQGIVWVGRRGAREIVVNSFLLLDGWIFGERGYQCKECYQADIGGMVDAARRHSGMRPHVVKGSVAENRQIKAPEAIEEAVERLMKVVDFLDPLGEQISARYWPTSQKLSLRQMNDPRPISGEFDLSRSTGLHNAAA